LDRDKTVGRTGRFIGLLPLSTCFNDHVKEKLGLICMSFKGRRGPNNRRLKEAGI
jgi:hypothetical protein